MTTEQVEQKVRETLHAVDLDRVRAPGDLVEKVVRRRARRRFSQVAGTAAAVAAITAGAVLGFGGGGVTDQDRPTRTAASPEGWKPWRISAPGATERGCLVDGAALYCAGYKYDAAKFDANTGERLWTVKVNGDGDGRDHPFAVRDGVLYGYRNHTADKQPNGDYAGGTDLMALNTDTGKVLWTVELASDNRDDQAALLIDGAVLANAPTDRTLSAVDPRTGEVKWRHTWDKGIWCDRTVLNGVPYLLCAPDTKNPPGYTDVFRLDPVTGRTEKVTDLPGRQGIIGISGDRMALVTVPPMESKTLTEEARRAKTLVLTLVDSSGKQTSRSYRVEGGRPPSNSSVIVWSPCPWRARPPPTRSRPERPCGPPRSASRCPRGRRSGTASRLPWWRRARTSCTSSARPAICPASMCARASSSGAVTSTSASTGTCPRSCSTRTY